MTLEAIGVIVALSVVGVSFLYGGYIVLQNNDPKPQKY
jgi:hypothetical protein